MFMTYLFVRPNRSQILSHKICELQPNQMTGSTTEVNPPHFPFYRIQTSVLPDKLPTSNYHSIRCIDPTNQLIIFKSKLVSYVTQIIETRLAGNQQFIKF